MRLRILMVEDNHLNRELVSALLEGDGWEVVAVDCAQRFREHLQTGARPDLVLMDIVLPDADGVTLLCELRAVPALAKTPVLALTAQALSGDRARFLAAGFDEVITKPIDTRVFAAQVAALAAAAPSSRGQ